jgi:hypothetical protein
MEELRSAIDSLYVVFASYRAPEKLGRCKHGQPEDERHFLATPLRHFSANDLPLAHFSWEAITTWGTVEDFKYFLPRLFEIATFETYRYDPEVLFKKLTLSRWSSWAQAEQDAISGYFHALWRKALVTYPTSKQLPSFLEIDDCLCSIGNAVDDLEPFLTHWEQGRTVAARENLAVFASNNAESLLGNGELWNAFWQDRQEQAKQVIKWLIRPTTVTLLTAGGDQGFSDAARMLVRLQRSAISQ